MRSATPLFSSVTGLSPPSPSSAFPPRRSASAPAPTVIAASSGRFSSACNGSVLLKNGRDRLDAVACVVREAGAERVAGVERALSHEHLRRDEVAQHRHG